jgi:hypothetical protein
MKQTLIKIACISFLTFFIASQGAYAQQFHWARGGGGAPTRQPLKVIKE